MKLVRPTKKHEKQVREMIQEFIKNDENKIHGASKAHQYKDDYLAWIDYLSKIANPSQDMLNKGYVETTQYVLFHGDKAIGFFCARFSLTAKLLDLGGHIGYSIRPSKRKQNYASNGLILLIDKYKNKESKVLLCCYKDNYGSAKTIINAGGYLDNEVLYKGRVIQRYWIEIPNK